MLRRGNRLSPTTTSVLAISRMYLKRCKLLHSPRSSARTTPPGSIDYVSSVYRDLKIGQHFLAESRIKSVIP